MTKKRQTVRAGNIEVTPITAAEHRVLDRKIKKRYERLRKRYKEIRGKRVDWISHTYEEGSVYVGIRFMDKTYFFSGIQPADCNAGNRVFRYVFGRRKNTQDLLLEAGRLSS